MESCPICLDALSSDPAAAFVRVEEGSGRVRACCSHHAHFECARRLRPQQCPLCREPFLQLVPLRRAEFVAHNEEEVYDVVCELAGSSAPQRGFVERLLVAVFPLRLQRFQARVDTIEGLEGGRFSEASFCAVLRVAKESSGGSTGNTDAGGGGAVHLSLSDRLRHRLRFFSMQLVSATGGAVHGLVVGALWGAFCTTVWAGNKWSVRSTLKALGTMADLSEYPLLLAFELAYRLAMSIARVQTTAQGRTIVVR
eukprot:Hpha_TRINITY_DN26895_c0_g1::TRINITY_DN26895_c0_g1_i1::g.17375::m.17375